MRVLKLRSRFSELANLALILKLKQNKLFSHFRISRTGLSYRNSNKTNSFLTFVSRELRSQTETQTKQTLFSLSHLANFVLKLKLIHRMLRTLIASQALSAKSQNQLNPGSDIFISSFISYPFSFLLCSIYFIFFQQIIYCFKNRIEFLVVSIFKFI